MGKVRDILRAKGLDVFVPNEHQSPLEFGTLEWRAATFKSDVDAIDNCDVMVAVNCQGNYDDAGTMWEIGYAFAKGIPVVVVNTTGETINLMIADSLHSLLSSYDELQEYDFDKIREEAIFRLRLVRLILTNLKKYNIIYI